MATNRPRVLLISGEPLGEAMAGPAIRTFQIGRVLSSVADVTVAGPGGSNPPTPELEHVAYQAHDPKALREPIAAADMIIAQPQWPLVTSWMRASGARLVFDLFVPETLEALERYPAQSRRARLLLAYMRDRLTDALRVGHHFICNTERQRDLWIGAMLDEGLLTPAVSERDPSLRSVIELVPYGTPPDPPLASGRGGAAARFAGIDSGDEIVLWASAIWPWFDAETAIRAMALLRERRPDARLVFMGQAAGVAEQAAARAAALARELGLFGRSVFFNDRWVPYHQRVDWLLEASCGVSTHFENMETRFAFRTRLLDCFWAGLPVVATHGEELADLADREGAGRVVPERDPAALADALDEVLDRGRDAYRPPLARLAERFTWERSAQPLIEWAQSDRLPPRLGDGGPLRRPGHVARSAAYRTGRATLAAVGASRLSRLLTAPEG
ncbi:MAG TPA: glycosyltransferase family 4 protein [Thermoleophilaceae bacterium]|nr:glycosyltransferase family 4 protein [Thermoleophilaceae bacterium]